jgi:hypothetical protein
VPINKEKDVQITSVISKELAAKLQAIADDQERTVNKQIAFILKEYAAKYSKSK